MIGKWLTFIMSGAIAYFVSLDAISVMGTMTTLKPVRAVQVRRPPSPPLPRSSHHLGVPGHYLQKILEILITISCDLVHMLCYKCQYRGP